MQLLMSKRLAKGFRKLLVNNRALFFLNGFLLSTTLYFYMEDSYEKSLFEALASYVKGQKHIKATDENILLNSLHVIYSLETYRNKVFSNAQFYSAKSSLFHPLTFDLMTANGACGSYTFLLSRILSEFHIPNRIAQMAVKGKYGGHILLEAQTSHGWAVLDPLYDLCFTRPDGHLASFANVHNNWNYYRKQVPAGYDTTYCYEGVRYTNWQKIPVVMPFLKKVLTLVWGQERTAFFSLRVLTLRKFHILFWVSGILYLLLLLSIIRSNIQISVAALIAFLSFGRYNKIPGQKNAGEASRKLVQEL
jgi:hypothetical protein